MVRVNGKVMGIVGLWVLLFAGFSTAEAAPLPISVMCPGTATTVDREFTLTATTEVAPLGDATVGCYAFDSGNMNDDEFDGSSPAWILIDKDESPDSAAGSCLDESCLTVTGLGATGGTFSIASGLWGAYNELLIGFKVGTANGQGIDPDWAAFILSGGITDGTWSVTHNNGLSHASLWGRFNPDRDVTAVPEPASLFLLGSGLLVAARRRRAKR
jgi:hypothetical protein